MLVGWCGFYFIESCAHPLPGNLTASRGTWDDLQVQQRLSIKNTILRQTIISLNLLQDSSWPVFFHALAIIAASLSVIRGVATIEPVNKVIVPILLGIVVFSFYWGIFLDGAADGIIHMFKPHWGE